MNDVNKFFKEIENEMEVVLKHFSNEISELRSNNINPKLFNSLGIEYYGEIIPLEQISSITIEKGNHILIKPYDKNSQKNIVYAITKKYGDNFNPICNSESIIINFPPLTEEIRKTVVKQLHGIEENNKIRIRQIRREYNSKLDKIDEITKNEVHVIKNKIQKITDDFSNMIVKKTKDKEKQILSI